MKEDGVSESPEAAGAAEDLHYVECPVDTCGELLLLHELDYHLELHSEESGGTLLDDPMPTLGSGAEQPPPPSITGPSRAHREAERHLHSHHDAKDTRQAKAISAWKRLLKMPDVSSAHRILSSKRSRDDTQAAAGHSTRGKRLGVSGSSPQPIPCQRGSADALYRRSNSESTHTKTGCRIGS